MHSCRTTSAFVLASLVSLGLAAAGCNDPAKDKAQATVSSVAAAASSAPAAKPAGATKAFAFNQDGSKIEFVGSKVTGSHNGSFGTFAGTIDLADAIEQSRVTVDIQIDSVTTDAAKLTGHLKSPDFFDSAKFAKATFTSTSITAGGAKGATHTISGTLELHGLKKQITFPATIIAAGGSVTANAEFAVNRKDFGIAYAGKADDLIRDEVVVKLTIKAAPKA